MGIFVCEGCGTKLSLPDDRLPATGAVQATCPRCKAKVVIGPRQQGAAAGGEAAGYSSEVLERFEDGVRSALVLHDVEAQAAQAAEQLATLGYRPSRAATVEEARARIKFNNYELVVIHERFGASGAGPSPILAFLNGLPMAVRRQMFVALVGPGMTTFDRMEAFVQSANLVVSEADLPGLGKILKNSIAENELFYRVFNETLKGLGRG